MQKRWFPVGLTCFFLTLSGAAVWAKSPGPSPSISTSPASAGLEPSGPSNGSTGLAAEQLVRSMKLGPHRADFGFEAFSRFIDAEGTFKTWRGEAVWLGSDLTTMKVWAEFDVASVDTDNGMRDEHLVEENFFAAKQWPQAVFRSKTVTRRGETLYDVAGTLTMLGKTLPVTFLATMEPMGAGLKVSATFDLDRTLWGMDSYLGALQPNPVEAQVRIKLRIPAINR